MGRSPEWEWNCSKGWVKRRKRTERHHTSLTPDWGCHVISCLMLLPPVWLLCYDRPYPQIMSPNKPLFFTLSFPGVVIATRKVMSIPPIYVLFLVWFLEFLCVRPVLLILLGQDNFSYYQVIQFNPCCHKRQKLLKGCIVSHWICVPHCLHSPDGGSWGWFHTVAIGNWESGQVRGELAFLFFVWSPCDGKVQDLPEVLAGVV